jgi:hypothetical protein
MSHAHAYPLLVRSRGGVEMSFSALTLTLTQEWGWGGQDGWGGDRESRGAGDGGCLTLTQE